MKPPNADCVESRAHLTRLPDLADPVLQFDLSAEIEKLQTRESWRRETGRSSETLVRQQGFRVVLILMKTNTRMGEHTKLVVGFRFKLYGDGSVFIYGTRN